MIQGCKSFFIENVIYACRIEISGHAGLHRNTVHHNEESIAWGNKAPGSIPSSVGTRFVAIRGKDPYSPNSNDFSHMGIKDFASGEFVDGPYEYENHGEFTELQEQARILQKEWDDKLKLLDAEAVNTKTCFASLSVGGKEIKFSPSEYIALFEQEIQPSDFDVGQRAMITYHIPNAIVYDNKTASELHEEFTTLVAHRAEKLALTTVAS